MNKNSQTTVYATRGIGGRREEVDKGKRGKYMVLENLLLGGEHAMQYIEDVLL